ncbi:MAG TPA: D-alanine--D-alanine ligase [Fimbriimonadaceae bacterium]|nr:D-alanine--D-alanine ligase [Fimbriimonadaceae bacterium]
MRTPAEIAEFFAPREALGECKSLFLVGIGGAGMSGLVPLALAEGFAIAGSDAYESEVTRSLGVPVTVGHFEALPEGVDALVLTDAIDLAANPEVRVARARGLRLFRRSQLLGWLLRSRKVAAVTGTHGKTTTTGLLGSALIHAGLDPLVVVGASVPDFGGPVRNGRGEWAVVEACEAYDGLRDIDPSLVLLTNLELDHADFHGDYAGLKSSVLRFVRRLPKDGILIYAASDAGATEVAKEAGVTAEPYVPIPGLDLSLPGEHNVLNASGAMAAAKRIAPDADVSRLREGLQAFHGAERRLQVLLDTDVTVVDDYAHHPTEVAVSIQALRSRYPGRRLIVVYQPHLYSRTKDFGPQLAEALSAADEVVLTDIYPAREAPIPGISSAVLAEWVDVPCRYVPSRHQLAAKVRRWLAPQDIVVGMGAGTIANFAPALIAELEDRPLAGLSRPLRIAVLYAGDSSEREVSIHSGREILAALTRLGHDAQLLDATELLLGKGDVTGLTGPHRPDLAFLAVHGTHAEDGAIQGFLELLGIPYTGSGIQASALAMDKSMTKRILEASGIRVPRGVTLRDRDDAIPFSGPLVVKPNAEGSTVGVAFVREPSELCPGLAKAFSYGDEVIAEELIEGTEISVPVLVHEALPPVEIVPATGLYDFTSKYTPGATEEIVPARLPAEVLAESQHIALKAHRLLGCEGATRTDMMVRGAEIFVLEVNTLPGMTRTSLLPNSAAAHGIDFDTLCERLVRDALTRSGAPH